MKKVLFLTVLALAALDAGAAGDTIKVKSRVMEATIFFSGAEVVHEIDAQLAKGVNNVIIQGLSPDIDVNSIRIRANNGVLISSFEFMVESVATDGEIKVLQDTLERYQTDLGKIRSILRINDNLLKTLQNAVDKGADSKDSRSEDIISLIEYYDKKMKDTEEYTFRLRQDEKELTRKAAETGSRIQAIKNRIVRDRGALKLALSSSATTRCTFSLMYYTPSASWSPYHDISVSSIDNPVKIISKAKVMQTTGVDWEQVKLKLSTSVPSFGKTAPLFTAWILRQPQTIVNRMNDRSDPMMQNTLSYKRLQIKEIDTNGEQAEQENLILPAETMEDHVAVSENHLNVTYDIDLPYSVPGNGNIQNIELQSQEIAAEYKHYCAPKLSPNTFLIAEINNRENLNLLSGNANITYEDTYIGETYIDAASTKDALSLTLGIDSRVAVKREKVNEMSSTKLLGNDIKQEYTYKITVRNNRNTPINMVLKDQYPKSVEKQIEVTLLKNTTTPTFHNEDVGVISWEEKFRQGESRTYNISYSVKYPKGVVLNLP